MKIDYTILLSCFLLTIFSCKSKNKIQSQTIEEAPTSTIYWNVLDAKLENTQFESHKDYVTYHLDESAFMLALNNNEVDIPDLDRNLNTFEVAPNSTMSTELAERYPELLTYSGVQQNNKLCQVRITTKSNNIDITVLCNDKTYYVKQFKNQNQSIYVLYDKQSLKHTRDIHN